MSPKTNAGFSHATNLLTLAGNKGVDEAGFVVLEQTGLLADLFEAAARGGLNKVDRGEFCQIINLNSPLKCNDNKHTRAIC